MLRKCTVLISVLVAVQSASYQGRRIIPVEVRYERLDHDFTSNLSEKVQLSPEELKENQLRLEKHQISDESDHSYLNKNLDEKPQLSPEELLQAPKHVPIHNSLKTHDINDLQRLGELRNSEPIQTSTQPPSKAALIEQLQGIIEKGLDNLRKNFMPKGNEREPSKTAWEKLERDVKEFFEQEKAKLDSRQEPGSTQQNVFQNVWSGFQEAANNFIQSFQNTNAPNGTSGDEGTQSQGPVQSFITYFTGGIQNIASNIQNQVQSSPIGGNATTLGDSGTGEQPTNIFGNFVSGVSQFFQGAQQQISQTISGNATQGDEGTGTGGSQSSNPVQQVFQSFGNLGSAFNQFVQGGQNKPQGSEDETTSQSSNPNFIQSIGQNIGSAFQNIQNQFRPSTNGSSAIPTQVSSIGNQIQQAASQVVSNNPIQGIISGGGSSESPAKEAENLTEKEESTTQSEKSEEMTATE